MLEPRSIQAIRQSIRWLSCTGAVKSRFGFVVKPSVIFDVFGQQRLFYCKFFQSNSLFNMLSLLSKQFASLTCGSSRQLISSVQKTRAATSVFGSINTAKNNYHTSSIYQVGRDPNVLTKEDSYDWSQLKQDVFKDFSYGVKKAPPVKKVMKRII